MDSELIGELQEMGPSAIAEIKALNSMSDSELEKYAALWSIKHAQAREQAMASWKASESRLRTILLNFVLMLNGSWKNFVRLSVRRSGLSLSLIHI